MLDCPAPDTLTFWLNAATTSGITLALAAAIGVVALVVTWRGGVERRGTTLVAVVSALAAASSIWAFTLARSLNSAFGEIARYYPDYPYDCSPAGMMGTPQYFTAIHLLSQQIALPREHAAEVTAIVALVIVVAQIIALWRWAKSAGPWIRTLPEGLEVEPL